MRPTAPLGMLILASLCTVPQAGRADHESEAWARVLDASPVTQTVRTPVESETCWNQQVRRRVPEYRSPTPMILGAVIGGVIGNQFGGGTGNDLMTAAGAALGSSIAADQQMRRYPPQYVRSTERRCSVDTQWREETQVVAWDVTYEYEGEVYTTRLDEHPGDRLRVRISVEPIN